ncbi:helix-turn-helix domain-containing protein [Microbacterium sp. NPDC096154]|uniref:PucR family transcriptional regulator n=1 Tax=Microbacterium sp. NPDC096154 TaxID=3155549 RepID=UPI00331B41B0
MHNPSPQAQLAAAARRLMTEEIDHLVEKSTAQLLTLEPSYKLVDEISLNSRMHTNIALALMRVSGDPIPKDLALSAFETGQMRAIQQIGLPAVSRSFRIDLRVLWEAFLADAERHHLSGDPAYLTALVGVWEAVEANINEMMRGYRETSEKLKQQDNELKAAAFQRLMSVGAEGNFAAIAKQLAVLSFDPNEPLLCVVSELRDSDYGALSAVQGRLSHHGVTHHFGWHSGYLVGLLQSPDLPVARLTQLLEELQGFRSGMTEVPRAAALTDAIRNTRVLVTAAAAPGLRELRDHWLEVVAHLEPTVIDALVEDIFSPFEDLSDYVREELTRVIDGFFSTNGSIAEIAASIYRHRNTVRTRLQQVEELTGLRLSVPRDAALLALAFPSWKRAGRARAASRAGDRPR